MAVTWGNFPRVNNMAAPRYDAPQGDVYFDNLQGFPSRGATEKNTHSVHLFLQVQKYLISIARDRCRLMVLFAMPTAVRLLQCTGILGCLCPRSSKVSLKIIPSWQFRNNAPNSASAADATTNRSIAHNV